MTPPDSSSAPEPELWRAVIAALLDEDARAVLAELAPRDIPPRRRERAILRLERAGLVRDRADPGAPADIELDTAALRAMLGGSRRPSGVERFLDRAGRIDRYPASPAERRELLVWVARRALSDAPMTEKELGEALRPYAPREDIAGLRRALVDDGVVKRTPSGSAYELAEDSVP